MSSSSFRLQDADGAVPIDLSHTTFELESSHKTSHVNKAKRRKRQRHQQEDEDDEGEQVSRVRVLLQPCLLGRCIDPVSRRLSPQLERLPVEKVALNFLFRDIDKEDDDNEDGSGDVDDPAIDVEEGGQASSSSALSAPSTSCSLSGSASTLKSTSGTTSRSRTLDTALTAPSPDTCVVRLKSGELLRVPSHIVEKYRERHAERRRQEILKRSKNQVSLLNTLRSLTSKKSVSPVQPDLLYSQGTLMLNGDEGRKDTVVKIAAAQEDDQKLSQEDDSGTKSSSGSLLSHLSLFSKRNASRMPDNGTLSTQCIKTTALTPTESVKSATTTASSTLGITTTASSTLGITTTTSTTTVIRPQLVRLPATPTSSATLLSNGLSPLKIHQLTNGSLSPGKRVFILKNLEGGRRQILTPSTLHSGLRSGQLLNLKSPNARIIQLKESDLGSQIIVNGANKRNDVANFVTTTSTVIAAVDGKLEERKAESNHKTTK